MFHNFNIDTVFLHSDLISFPNLLHLSDVWRLFCFAGLNILVGDAFTEVCYRYLRRVLSDWYMALHFKSWNALSNALR